MPRWSNKSCRTRDPKLNLQYLHKRLAVLKIFNRDSINSSSSLPDQVIMDSNYNLDKLYDDNYWFLVHIFSSLY